MKKHVAAVLVVLTSALVFDSHVDWVRQDDAPLLAVNGQRFDLHGWAAERWRQLRQDCSALPLLPLDSADAQGGLTAIAAHSPPDSRSARGLQWQQLGDWAVAEVAFDTLNPSLVVLRQSTQQGSRVWRVQERAVWSGSTAPWHSGQFVRRYLRQQAPEMPEALLQCVVVDPQRYRSGGVP
jgi:hypothetical protein